MFTTFSTFYALQGWKKKFTYKLSTMTIETKYNIGDEVWCMKVNRCICTKVKSIRTMIHHYSSQIEIEYFIEAGDWLQEGSLFPAKEELIKSL